MVEKGVHSKLAEFANTAKTIGKEDPRRIIHSVKVGLAITFVSLFYYFAPVFEGLGVAAIWAVLTVVVVFEYSVGATLGKGVNRIVATFLAAGLGVGAHRIANFCGDKFEPLVLGTFVFLITAVVTFLRFFPKLKARYDYGLMIFILTFSLVCVSAYREDEVIDMAQQRISTLIIGSFVAMATCVCFYPVWAGTDLHHLTADNLEKLGNFLEEFGQLCFKDSGEAAMTLEKRALLEGFKSVVSSKNSEDSLVNLAKWEPRHGRFRYRHPWNHYQKIGNLARECACTVHSLQRHLRTDTHALGETESQIRDLCTKISVESGKTLKELSVAMKTMTYKTEPVWTHIESSRSASNKLTSLFKGKKLLTTRGGEECQDDVNFDWSAVVSGASVASLLLDAASLSMRIAEAVEELALLARFKRSAGDDYGEKIGEDSQAGSELEDVVGMLDHRVIRVEKGVRRSWSCPGPPGFRHNEEGEGTSSEESLPPSLAMVLQSGE